MNNLLVGAYGLWNENCFFFSSILVYLCSFMIFLFTCVVIDGGSGSVWDMLGFVGSWHTTQLMPSPSADL